MMQNILLSFAWFSPGMVILLLFLFGTVGITIALELRKMKREREQGRYNRWYQRPRIFWGAMQGVAFLIMLADLALFRPPIFFSSAITIVGMIIILALGISALASIMRRTREQIEFSQERVYPPSERSSLATNPTITAGRFSLVMSTFMLLFFLGLGIFQFFFNPIIHQFSLYLWGMSALWLLLAFLAVRNVARLHYLKRIETRRFTLAIEERRAASEPASRKIASPLVPPISLRLKRTHILVVLALTLGLLIGFILPLVSTLFHLVNQTGDLFVFWIIAVFLGIFAGGPLLLIMVSLLRARMTIEATEYGLKLVIRGDLVKREEHIAWQEARLFASHKLPSLFFGQTKITTYELSDSRRMVTWKWVNNPQSLLAAWTPRLPCDEYHRQMQALHELIITRTRLLLYDLDNAEGEEKHQIELEVSQQ